MIPVKLKHSKPEANFNCIGLTVNPAELSLRKSIWLLDPFKHIHLRTNTRSLAQDSNPVRCANTAVIINSMISVVRDWNPQFNSLTFRISDDEDDAVVAVTAAATTIAAYSSLFYYSLFRDNNNRQGKRRKKQNAEMVLMMIAHRRTCTCLILHKNLLLEQ